MIQGGACPRRGRDMAQRNDEAPITKAALATARSALAAARGKRRLDLILDAENPGALVRALPADDLFLTIREIGLGDAVELVQLASPAQFRTFLDLACWRGDRVKPRSALAWLRAARAGSTDSPRAASRWKAKLAALDMEIVDLILRETLRVHDLEEDPDPLLTTDRFLRTPEGRFVVEFLAEGAEYMAVRGLVDDLYADDPFRASRFLSSIRWELPSELEETALRWRTGRLADLGYPSREEALSWFARPAAAHPPAGAPARPPGFYLERIGTGSLLARAAARLVDQEREHLELELVTAANAALVADTVDPGDLEAVRQAVEASRALVELGLEEAAGADEAKAADVLASTAVKSLFQRGFGRVLALKWRAEKLLASGAAGSRAAPFLDPPLGEALSALARARPTYFPGLELPRAEWGLDAAGAFEPRPFLSSAELSRAADALGLAEGLASLARDLQLAPLEGPDAPRLATVYLTALANERLGRGFAPKAIAVAEVPAAARVLERLEDPRLVSRGEPADLLAALARARGEELGPVRDGTAPRPESTRALRVKP